MAFASLVTSICVGSSLRGLHIPTSWGYTNSPRINQADPKHWHLLPGGMACEAAASLASAQSPIDVTPDGIVPAPWLPTLKLGGGYSINTPGVSGVFGDGSPPQWFNNGHTLELGPHSVEAGGAEDRRLNDMHVQAATMAAKNQAKVLSADPTSKTAAMKEEHYHAQQQLINPRIGSIDIGGISSLNFQGPTLEANLTDEGWNKLETVYDLLQLHLHWGSNQAEGSEHQIDGKAFPLEMHLVHAQRGNPYPTRSAGGLAVVSVMFEIGEENTNLADLTQQITKLKLGKLGSSITASSGFDVHDILPHGFESNYLTYRGSLTTPGCFESVNWIIAGETLTVSPEQLAALRSVDSLEAGVPLTKNFRPVQPRNGRVVWMKGGSAFGKLSAASTSSDYARIPR